jgi:uncharacterized lipoprotein YddW (UPF0748 family)
MFGPLTLALMLFSFFQRLVTRCRLFVSSKLAAGVNPFRFGYASALSLGVLVLALVLLVFYGAQSSSTQRPVRSQPLSIASEIRAGEIRGVWMTNVASSILFTPWGISRALNQLAAMDFNTVYPVVWNRGQTFYRSPTLKKLTGQPIDPLIALLHPQEDPLAEMVRVGHRKQLRVMPWFEYGFMVPMNSALAQQHPEWLTSRQNGSRQLTEDTFEAGSAVGQPLGDVAAGDAAGKARPLNRPLNSGAPAHLGWLNPMHPSVQGLLLGLVEEVIEAYDVDGIQLDDHFSLPVEFGYDPYTVSLYQAEHQGQSPPSNPADPDWIRWRAGKLSKFMNVLHARVKAKCDSLGRPRDRCTVSISPNPAKFAYRFQLQDWRSWVQQGWVDELVVQVYRDDLARFESELSKGPLQEAKERIPVSIGILTGTWRHPIAFEQIQQQVRSSRDRQFAGISFFYWDTLWSYFTPEAPQQRRQAFKQLMDE